MHRARDTTSGIPLIIAVVCLFLLVTPGLVSAAAMGANGTGIIPDLPVPPIFLSLDNTSGIEPNVTIVPTTPVPPVFMVLENATGAVNPPPLLIFDTPVIEDLTCTIYGIAEPGSGNVTITSIFWDWGDSPTLEYHGFPISHTYSSPGTYPLTITARQSDGQTVRGVTDVTVGEPVIIPTTTVTPTPTQPGGPGGPVVIPPPVLTLLEPAVDRMNVTLNGNLIAGSPGVTIESVQVDWDDGTSTTAADLPVTHQYSAAGIFTVAVTGNQSDGQSATRKIALEIKAEIPAPPGPTPSGPPGNDPPLFLIIAVMGIIGMVIVSAVLVTRGRKDPVNAQAARARAGPLLANRPSPEQLVMICAGTEVEPGVLDAVIQVAGEIAWEGREGKAIGTSFVVGDIANVLHYSKQFVLNPFQGHHETERQITDAGIQGTIKEFAQLDGAFLITGSGVVEAAGRCITVDMSQVNLPGGMGSRHLSVAGITKVTASIGVVVSQSGGLISIFRGGKIVYVIRS